MEARARTDAVDIRRANTSDSIKRRTMHLAATWMQTERNHVAPGKYDRDRGTEALRLFDVCSRICAQGELIALCLHVYLQ